MLGDIRKWWTGRRAPLLLEPADMVERLTIWISRTVEVHLWPTVRAGFGRKRDGFGQKSCQPVQGSASCPLNRARTPLCTSEQAATYDLEHTFLECAVAQAVRSQEQRGLGEALIQQWHQ
jgi:hypothetical protein